MAATAAAAATACAQCENCVTARVFVRVYRPWLLSRTFYCATPFSFVVETDEGAPAGCRNLLVPTGPGDKMQKIGTLDARAECSMMGEAEAARDYLASLTSSCPLRDTHDWHAAHSHGLQDDLLCGGDGRRVIDARNNSLAHLRNALWPLRSYSIYTEPRRLEEMFLKDIGFDIRYEADGTLTLYDDDDDDDDDDASGRNSGCVSVDDCVRMFALAMKSRFHVLLDEKTIRNSITVSSTTVCLQTS